MKNNKLVFIGFLTLALSLITACRLDTSSTQTHPENTPISNESTEASNPLDYQSAYADYLQFIWNSDAELEGAPYNDYLLYDINKDGTPELMVEYGNAEADRQIYVYTFNAESPTHEEVQADSLESFHLKGLDQFSSGHVAFYSWPNENGMMSFYGQMGSESISKLTLSDDRLAVEAIYQGPDDLVEYDSPETFVEGTSPITRFYKKTLTPLSPSLQEIHPLESIGQTSLENQSLFNAVLKGDQSFYATSVYEGSYYFEGETHLTDFLTPQHLDPYTDKTYQVTGVAYADFNGDQSNEMILRIQNDESAISYAIFSIEDSQVFAYYILYGEAYTLLDNGLLTEFDYENASYPWASMIYYKGKESFIINVSPDYIVNHQAIHFEAPQAQD